MQQQGHAFISYVHEDRERVERLERVLERSGIRVWRDTDDLWPGDDWKQKIRDAIIGRAFVFLACFSHASATKARSHQNEELILAVDEMRLRPPGQPWLIPIRFDEVDVPSYDLGAGRTLRSIQRVDLVGDDWSVEVGRLVSVIVRLLETKTHTADDLPAGGAALGVDAAVQTAKRQLAGGDLGIPLHDLIRQEVGRLADLDYLQPDAGASGNDQLVVVEGFLREAEILAALIATTAYWGRPATDAWWLGDIVRLGDRPLMSGSLNVLDRPRLPAVVMTWAAGIAAVARERDELLAALVGLEGVSEPGREVRTPAALAAGPHLLHTDDALARLYGLFRPIFVDCLALGLPAFVDAWERWQYLLLVAAHEARERLGTYLPLDRAGIRVDGIRPEPVPHLWLLSKLQRLGDSHPLRVAGFQVAVEGLTQIAAQLGEWAKNQDFKALMPGSGGSLPTGAHYPGSFTGDADERFHYDG